MEILDINYLKNKTTVNLFIIPELAYTKLIPDFSHKVLCSLPELKDHNCINDNGHEFEKELDNTELAHAFEHIMMELISKNDPKMSFIEAWTSWNWKENERHTYTIDFKYTNKKVFQKALNQTLNILNKTFSRAIVTARSFEFALATN